MTEVAAVYRRALQGLAPVLRMDGDPWDDGCGDITYDIGGWRVTVFNDCGDLDYTDSVTAPDGRHADFDDWCQDRFICCPLALLSPAEQDALLALLRAAQ